MIFIFSAIAISFFIFAALLFILAVYQFSVKGDASFYVMLFSLIFIFISFYGAVGYTYTKLKEAGVIIKII